MLTFLGDSFIIFTMDDVKEPSPGIKDVILFEAKLPIFPKTETTSPDNLPKITASVEPVIRLNLPVI